MLTVLGALVVELFALAQTQLHLHPAVLEVQGQRDQRHAVLHHAGVELDNLPLVHQKAAGPHRVFIEDVAVLVGTDVHTPDKKLAVFDGAESILQIHVAAPDGFDLRSGQLNAGLEALKHKVFVEGLAVGGDLLHALLLCRHLLTSFSVVQIILPHYKEK